MNTPFWFYTHKGSVPQRQRTILFCSSYIFFSFLIDLFAVDVSEEDKGNTKYEEISTKMKNKDYDNVVMLCTQEIDGRESSLPTIFNFFGIIHHSTAILSLLLCFASLFRLLSILNSSNRDLGPISGCCGLNSSSYLKLSLLEQIKVPLSLR